MNPGPACGRWTLCPHCEKNPAGTRASPISMLFESESATIPPQDIASGHLTLASRVGKPCRFCGKPLEHSFVDLGMSPLANAYLRADELDDRPEPFFPLSAYVCTECCLVQLEDWETPEAIFRDFAYFSSYSESWLDHARRYVADVSSRLGIGSGSQVVEIASNNGYLLQYYIE